MNGMNVDFVSGTITVTKAFWAAAQELGSEEYQALSMAQRDNPQMRVVTRSIRTGKRPNDGKGLTYNYMRRFISLLDPDNLKAFTDVQVYYDGFYESNAETYIAVKNWFLEHYPRHKDLVVESCPHNEDNNEQIEMAKAS